jgi:hypothetical protein
MRPGRSPCQRCAARIYLQDIRQFALTVEGQDRARGRMIARPEPQPGEDDGRPVSDMILRAVVFMAEEDIPPDPMVMNDDVSKC